MVESKVLVMTLMLALMVAQLLTMMTIKLMLMLVVVVVATGDDDGGVDASCGDNAAGDANASTEYVGDEADADPGSRGSGGDHRKW